MTKNLLALLLMSLLTLSLTACHNDGLSRDQRRVRKAAEKCYEYIQDEEYDRFVGEIAYADRMSPEYRSQMEDLIHESAANDREVHGELLSAVAVEDTIIGDLAHVFIQLTYADSLSEEVGMAMVRVDGEWKMQ